MRSLRLGSVGLLFLVAPLSCERACGHSPSRLVAREDASIAFAATVAVVDASVDAAATASTENGAVADDEVVLPTAPVLAVTTLAKSTEQLSSLAFDASSIYVHTPHGPRKIARAGGALEKAKSLTDGGAPGNPDETHAYYGGADFEATATAGNEHFLITSDSVLVQADNGAGGQLAKSIDATSRKAIVVLDKTGQAFWLEPAIHAVVTGVGAPAKPTYVMDVWSADGADLTIANGRVYVLDPFGRLASTKSDGSDARYLGNLWPDLSAPPVSVWISIDGTTLYAVADGREASESRIVKVDLAQAVGSSVTERYGGLICARRIAVADVANEKKLASATELLDFFADGLKAGDAAIIISSDGASADAAAKIEAFLRRRYGANAKIERRSMTTGKPTATSIVIGLDRGALGMLLAP
jgi:hypothetical protein